MLQFDLVSHTGTAMIDVFFAKDRTDIPAFWLENYTVTEKPAPDYWVSPLLRDAVAKDGWCNIRRFRLVETSKPQPPKAIWF